MKSVSFVFLFISILLQSNAQSKLFEYQLSGAIYADIAPSKGEAKIGSKAEHPEFDCKRSIYGFETTIQQFSGQTMLLAIASPSSTVTIKDFSAFMQKELQGFERIDNNTMKQNDPPNTLASAGFFSEDKLRIVTLYISTDSTMRMIVIDKPGSERPNMIYVKDQKSKKFGFKDIANPRYWRIAPKYSEVDLFSEGFAAVCLGGKKTEYGISGGKWGFVDVNGTEITRIEYESVFDFSEGIAVVRLGGKYGYINKKGTLITPIQFTSAKPFSGGIAWVTIGDEAFGVDRSGNRIK